MIEIFNKLSQTKQLDNLIKKDKYNIYLFNSIINNDLNVLYHLYQSSDKSIVLVCPNIYKATICYEALVQTYGLGIVNFYVMDDFTTTEVLASSPEYKEERLFTIASIINNEKRIIVTNLGAVLRKQQSIDYFKEAKKIYKTGEELDLNSFFKQLVKNGYKRVSKVEKVGDFSQRGEVIDIFPLGEDYPIRFDLFDDEIESIKYFDVESQRTIQSIDHVAIYPVSEILIDDSKEFVENIKSNIKDKELLDSIEQDLHDIENYNFDIKTLKYLNYANINLQTFLDYLDNPLVAYLDAKDMKDIELHLNEDAMSTINTKLWKTLNLNIYIPFVDIILNHNSIYFSEFKNYFDFPITDMIDYASNDVFSYHGDISLFFKELNSKDEYYVCISDNKQYELFNDALSVNKKDNITLLKEAALSVSYFDNERRIHIISGDSLYKHELSKEKKYRSSGLSVAIESKDDLQEGDYVVHYDYGIAKYAGLKSIELNGIINDYLLLLFNGGELYVPVENIGVLDKYQGSEGHIPHLSSLGTKKWEKKKAEVREKIKEIAGDLISIQAKRNEAKGYVYPSDSDEQILFESDFEFEETKDQIDAVSIIKKEMEKGTIIDRLICGDVGYGKTEVAMRIAFKTVMAGKQVAYLAPTTILTRQHFFTFKERMEKYGINIAIINRFVSKDEIRRTVEGLKKGNIDIVIGTHALLNDAITYKDLGLLIVDEEQRFGVEHKEKIKKLKENVNVLTLSATPIPRTLQMSLVGIRELSLIQTPPKNRFPVKTYVMEENDIVIKEAIYQELGRGGQVFYLHNKVDDLDKVYNHIKELVPEARIAIGHGKMDKDKLEDVIQAFIDKEVDVLLCTTIIETGIDIPNSNTLIVDMADHLGLSQMYQLRGRVGRSDKLSYAYFTYNKKGVLAENSQKRLFAIKEFTSLGSGYKIALRDLSIRGAGDILGKEQSGFIDDVGMDMYMRLLDEEVKKLKGEKETSNVSPSWQINVSKHVDDSYVKDEDIKLYIHKRINSIDSFIYKKELIEELIDRFGKLSDELKIYIEKTYLDIQAKRIGIEKINDFVTYVQLIFSEEYSHNVDASDIFSIAFNISPLFDFEYKARKIIVKYNKKKDMMEWLTTVNLFLEKLYNNNDY